VPIDRLSYSYPIETFTSNRKENPTMNKRIRTALAALAIAFAIAFSLGPLDGFFGMSVTPSVYAGGAAVKL
jgi:hypothetical protein